MPCGNILRLYLLKISQLIVLIEAVDVQNFAQVWKKAYLCDTFLHQSLQEVIAHLCLQSRG